MAYVAAVLGVEPARPRLTMEFGIDCDGALFSASSWAQRRHHPLYVFGIGAN